MRERPIPEGSQHRVFKRPVIFILHRRHPRIPSIVPPLLASLRDAVRPGRVSFCTRRTPLWGRLERRRTNLVAADGCSAPQRLCARHFLWRALSLEGTFSGGHFLWRALSLEGTFSGGQGGRDQKRRRTRKKALNWGGHLVLWPIVCFHSFRRLSDA